jgi:8-oxo-dGTP pyrophosphatase MutT (NUDIX family)
MSLQPRISPAAHSSPFARPVHTQLAALCWRPVKARDKAGDKTGDRAAEKTGGKNAVKRRGSDDREVLLVTSSSGRWILPKGWPIQSKSAPETALTEAWEEGGVKKGKVSRRPLGSFIALKTTVSGDEEPCLLRVFAVKVQKTVDDYPEAEHRNRIWVSPQVAATMVDEDGLREILSKF